MTTTSLPTGSRYAQHVGRVGALAVALGVGLAVSTATPYVASAAPANSDSSSSSSAPSKKTTGSSARSRGKQSSDSDSGNQNSSPAAAAASTGKVSTRVISEVDDQTSSDTAESDSTPSAHTDSTPPASTNPAQQTSEESALASTAPAAASATAVVTTVAPLAAKTTAAATTNTPFRPIRALVAGVLSVFGYNPLATPSPGDPAPNPILEGIWGLYRRIESFIANETPTAGTPTVNAVNAQGQITGSLNATDYDGDTLVYTVIQGEHGLATVDADGTFTYTPVIGYTGADTFQVQISDTGFHLHFHLFDLFNQTGHSTTETVNVVVPDASNAAPVITVVSGPGTPGAGGVVSGSFTVTDADGDTVSVSTTDPTRGGVVVTYDIGSGLYHWTYTPTQASQILAGLSASPITDGFTISASDGTAAAVTTDVTGITVAAKQFTSSTPISIQDGTPVSIVLNSAGTLAFVTIQSSSNNNGTLAIYDTKTGTKLRDYTAGSSPLGLAVNADGTKAYVANQDDTITAIDIITDTVTTITTGGQTERLVLTPDGGKLYVTSATGGIIVVDVVNNMVGPTISLNAKTLLMSADGSTLYSVNKNGTLSLVDTSLEMVSLTKPMGSLGSALIQSGALSPDGKSLWVAGGIPGTLSVFDAQTLEFISKISVSGLPGAIAVSPDNSVLYIAGLAGGVTVVDATTNTVITTLGSLTDGALVGLTTSADGTTLYFAEADNDQLTVLTV
ncbi:Ig-like domain-containing protein [Mycobacterium sp. M26]|uniref:Ig-like domain-containing protein n=1 Tax=Mycobacterium sp. M26 TaxID=1762962 RepID=UPI00073F5274|nr:Ig-like domain-containing protein [Mycobacterium sp. M26]